MQFHYQSNKQTYVRYIDSLSLEYAQNPQHLMDLSTGLSANIYNKTVTVWHMVVDIII